MTDLDALAAGPGAPIEERLDAPLRAYWAERVSRHVRDAYAGVPLAKFPEDLRVYEHLLWAMRAEAVVEVGVYAGASLLWFRDRLATLAAYGRGGPPRVVGVDVDAAAARRNLDGADPGWRETITLVEGDVRAGDTVAAVRAAVPEGARCLVVEDSLHEYATTRATLDGLAGLVPEGGFLVVEDGCVDVEALRVDPAWPRGVLPAVADWLASPAGAGFARRRDLELYGITCHPGGFLQRRA